MAESFEDGGTFLTEAAAFEPPEPVLDAGGFEPLGVPAPQHPPVTPAKRGGATSPVPAPPSASLDRTRPTAGKNTRLLVQEGTTLKWGGAPYAVADVLPPSLQKKRPATSNAQLSRRPLTTGEATGVSGTAARLPGAAAPGRGPPLLARAGPVRPRTSLGAARTPLYPGGLARTMSGGAGGAAPAAGPSGSAGVSTAGAAPPLSRAGTLLPPGAAGSAASRLSALRTRSAIGGPRSGLSSGGAAAPAPPSSAGLRRLSTGSGAGSTGPRRMSSGGASTGAPAPGVAALSIGAGAALPAPAGASRAGFAGRALGGGALSAGGARRPGTSLGPSSATTAISGGSLSAGAGGVGPGAAKLSRPGTTGPSYLGGGRRGLSAGRSTTPGVTATSVGSRVSGASGYPAAAPGTSGLSARPPASAPGVSRRSLSSGTGSRLAARGGLQSAGRPGLPQQHQQGQHPAGPAPGSPPPPPGSMQGGILFDSGEGSSGAGNASAPPSPSQSSGSSAGGANVYAFSVDHSGAGRGGGGSPSEAASSPPDSARSGGGGALLSMPGDPSTLTHAQRQFILQEEYRRSISPMHTGSTPPSARAPPSPLGQATGAASLGISGMAVPGSPSGSSGEPQMSKSGLFRLGPALGVSTVPSRPFPPAGGSVASTPTSLLPSPAFGIAPGPAVPLHVAMQGGGGGGSGMGGSGAGAGTPRGPTTDVFSTTFDPVAVLNRAVAVANRAQPATGGAQGLGTPRFGPGAPPLSSGYVPTPRGSAPGGGSLFPPSSYAPPSFSSSFGGAQGGGAGGAGGSVLGGGARFYPLPASLTASSAMPPTPAGPAPGSSSSPSRPPTSAAGSGGGDGFSVPGASGHGAPPLPTPSLEPGSMAVPPPTPNIFTRGSLALAGLSRGSGPALPSPSVGGTGTPSSAPAGSLFPVPQLRPAAGGDVMLGGALAPAAARPGSNTTMLAAGTPRGGMVTTPNGLVLPRGMGPLAQPGAPGGAAPVAAVSSVSSEITARLQARIQEAFGRVSEQVRHAFTAPSKPGVLGVPIPSGGDGGGGGSSQ